MKKKYFAILEKSQFGTRSYLQKAKDHYDHAHRQSNNRNGKKLHHSIVHPRRGSV